MSFLTFPFFLITESATVVPVFPPLCWSQERRMWLDSATFDLDPPLLHYPQLSFGTLLHSFLLLSCNFNLFLVFFPSALYYNETTLIWFRNCPLRCCSFSFLWCEVYLMTSLYSLPSLLILLWSLDLVSCRPTLTSKWLSLLTVFHFYLTQLCSISHCWHSYLLKAPYERAVIFYEFTE